MAIGLVLFGGAWDSATGTVYDLSKLKSVCVGTKPLAGEGKSLGLNREEIISYTYVWLKGKLPRLQVGRWTGTPTGACKGNILFVRVTMTRLSGGRGYSGVVEIQLVRPTLWESGISGLGIAYLRHYILTGPPGAAVQHVNETLDALLTDFAAEYYEAGNP
jgi:hypothetical protein